MKCQKVEENSITKEELFNQNINLAYWIANKYRVNYLHEYEDIKQVALMGLWKAVSKYDGRTKAGTFFGIVIQNEIKYYLRNVKKNDNMYHLEQEIADKITLADTLASDEDIINDFERQVDNEIAKMHLNAEVGKLGTRNREIFNCLMQGKTQCEIANRFGISQTQVSRIRGKIIEKVKQEMPA